MASLDKEIEVLMLKGEKGYSSYQEAVANGLFVGTLEQWIETFATPDDYVTRYEFKKVTQEEYDALAEAEQLQANCYYIITDDDTWEILEDVISRVGTLETSMETAQGNILDLQNDVSDLNELKSKQYVGTDTYTATITNDGNKILIKIEATNSGTITALDIINGDNQDIQLMLGNTQYSLKNRLAKNLILKSELKAISSLTYDNITKYHRVERQIGDNFYPCQLIWDNSSETVSCYYFSGSSFVRLSQSDVVHCFYYNYE